MRNKAVSEGLHTFFEFASAVVLLAAAGVSFALLLPPLSPLISSNSLAIKHALQLAGNNKFENLSIQFVAI